MSENISYYTALNRGSELYRFVSFCFSGRIRNRISRPKCISQSSELNGTSMASLSGDHSSLGLLQAMLGQVEADLDTLSPDTDPTSARCQEPHRKQGLTGFSVALVSTLGRLVNLLKQVWQLIIHVGTSLYVPCVTVKCICKHSAYTDTGM